MGRASISIAITSNFNGSGIDAAMRKMEQLSVSAVAAHGKFGAASVKAGAELGKASHRLSSFGQSMAKVGDALTTHVTLPMGVAAAAAIKSAIDIDTAWYNVRKTVDMTEAGYQKLKQGAIDLSNTQPVSAETILNIEALGGQLGISNNQLESFAKTVSGLDIATNMSAEESATALAQFSNIVQMSENDLDNFGSALVDLGNHSATTESDIMNLALRFASAGHVAGMSNQEILGISTALSSLGMKADAGGSALSQIINKISLDVDTNGEHLEAWAQLAGKSIDDFKRAWKDDAAGTFEDVLKGVANAGDEMNAVLDSAGVTQIRNSDAMRRLASSGDLMSESIKRANTAWEQNTALTREVENRNESLASQFEVLKNRATNTMALIGEPIAKMVLKTVEGFDPMIQGIQDAALAFNQADPVMQRFAFNLGATAMAAGPVLSVVGRGIDLAGQFGVKIGRVSQQFGVYTEALHTNDLAMIETLDHTNTFAARAGLARNEVVKAAGGIDNFRAKVKGATEVIREQAMAQETGKIAVERYSQALGVTGKRAETLTHSMFNNAQAIQFGTQANQRYKEALFSSADGMVRGNDAMKLASESAKSYRENLRSSTEATQFLSDASERYREALANGAKSGTEAAQAALQYKDSTSASAVAANKAAAAILGQDKVAVNIKGTMTEAAQAALGFADNTSKSAVEASRSAKEALGYSKALSGGKKSATEAAQAALNYSQSMKGQKEASKRAASATKDLSLAQIDAVAKTKEGAAAIEQQTQSMEKSAPILEGAMNVLLGIGGIAITAAAFAGIEYLATQAQVAAERAENLKNATTGLQGALSDIGPAQQSATQSTREFTDSLGQTHQHVMNAIENQAGLADSFRQIDSAASSEIGTLERARSAIEQYAFAGDLNQAAQYRLQQAIATVNETCGTQYSVIDSARGIIADETGAVLQNEQAIVQNIEARKKMVKLQAMEQKYSELYAAQTETATAHAEAVHKLNEAEERRETILGKIEEKQKALRDAHIYEDTGDIKLLQGELEDVDGEITKLKQDVSESEQALNAASDATNALESSMDALANSTSDTGDALSRELLDPAGKFAPAFDQAKSSIDAFNAVCHDMGLNFDALNSLSPTEIDDLATAFEKSGEKATGVVTALEGMGDKGKKILDSLVSDWTTGFSSGTKDMISSVASMRQESEAMLMAYTRDFGIAGETATQMFLSGLNSKMDLEPAANLAKAVYSTFQDNISPEKMQVLAQSVGDAFKNGLSPEQAGAIATSYSRALSDGMNAEEAANKATQVVQKITDATSKLDPSAASAVMTAYSSAINSGVSIDEASSKMQQGIERINSSTANLSPAQASAAVQAFANAINSGVSLDEAVSQVDSGMQKIEAATQGLDPSAAAAAMQAFADALNQGANIDEAATKVQEGIQRIGEAAGGLDTSAGEAAMKAFADAINEGANFDEAVSKIEEGLKQIEAAAGGLDTSAGQAAMQAFVDAINQGANFDDAISKAQSAVQQLESTLNGANFSSAAGNWQMQFANLGNTAHSTLQGFVPILSDDGRVLGQAPANSLDPQTYVWAQKAAEGPQAYNNALLPWGATFTGTVQSMMNQVTTPLGTVVPIFHSKGSEAAQNYGFGLSAGGIGVYGLSQTVSDSAVQGLQTGVPGAGSAGTETSSSYANTIGSMQGIAIAAAMATQVAVVLAYKAGIAVAMTAGQMTGQNYCQGLTNSAGGANQAGLNMAQQATLGLVTGVPLAAAAGLLFSTAATLGMNMGIPQAMSAGQLTGYGYVTGLQSGLAVAVSMAAAAVAAVTGALNSGIGPASSAGSSTGQAYATSLAAGLEVALALTVSAVAAIGSALMSGAGPAGAAGSSTGLLYATNLTAGLNVAVQAAGRASSSVASALNRGVGPAGAAGRSTGTAYASGVSTANAAIGLASSISSGVGSAFGAGSGYAYSSGYSLGQNFAAGVSAGGAAAVAAARRIASEVAAILKHSTPKKGPLRDDDVWGYHFAENITTGMKKGTPGIKTASLDLARTMSAPVKMASDTFAIAQASATKAIAAMERSPLVTNSQLRSYQAVAERVTERVVEKTVYEKAAPATTVEAVSEGPVTRDELFTIFRQATLSALERSGAAHPVVYLDGRQVSKQLVNSMDSELGRLQRSRW